MTKYNIGIIGAGMYGKVLIRCLRQDDRANVTWVNSASEATTRAAAEEFGLDKWTLDYREILADPAVDAVVIATPPYLHAEQLAAALEAGKARLTRETNGRVTEKRQQDGCYNGATMGPDCARGVLPSYAFDA